jgi:hypothetical protein
MGTSGVSQAVTVFLVNFVRTQSGNCAKEDLAKFGYKQNMKVDFLNILLYFWLSI